jgi:phage-related tail protein
MTAAAMITTMARMALAWAGSAYPTVAHAAVSDISDTHAASSKALAHAAHRVGIRNKGHSSDHEQNQKGRYQAFPIRFHN